MWLVCVCVGVYVCVPAELFCSVVLGTNNTFILICTG